MKVTVFGTGYVGLVTGACLADVGNDVICVDTDAEKISMLQNGGIPIYEPGLEEVVFRNTAARRLTFTTDTSLAVEHGYIQYIAVGTPPDQDGSADLTHVLAVARSIGMMMTDFKVIVNKSTVPVGTANKVRYVITSALAERGAEIDFSVVSNPEFLKEGAAINDFMRPDRIVIGCDDQRAIGLMHELYAPFQRNHERIIVMDNKSAELTKYAANAMLATRISFMNQLAKLAESLDADIEMVRQGIGSDPRIGFSFLYPGCGYGGSCFPKDVKALLKTASRDALMDLSLLRVVEEINEDQKHVLYRKAKSHFGDLRWKHFAIWGLAFKPNTDDMREASSLVLINDLLSSGASITVYDPVALNEAKRIFSDKKGITYASTPLAALHDANALFIVTEWKEFHSPDWAKVLAEMAAPAIFDGRNLYDPQAMKAAGFDYFAIGRKSS